MGLSGAPVAVGTRDWQTVIMRLPKSVLMPTDKHVAHLLCKFANPDGTRVFPGVDILAFAMCVSNRTVIRSLEVLRDAGLLIRVGHGSTKGSADEYRLSVPGNVAELLALPDALAPNMWPNSHPRSVSISTRYVTSVSPTECDGPDHLACG